MSIAADSAGVARPARVLAFWLALLLVPLLFVYGVHRAHRVLPARDVVEVREAMFSTQARRAGRFESRTIPERVALPHDWRWRHAQTEHAEYRIALDFRVAPNRLWGIFIPRHSMASSVYVNGQLSQGRRHDPPIDRLWHRPQLISVSNGLLRRGSNEIAVIVTSDPPGAGMLRELYVGPMESLAPYQRFHELLLVGAPLTITVLMLAMGVFIGTLWCLRRRESVYGWFAAAVLAWAVHSLNVLVVAIPVPSWLWEAVRFVSLGWVVILTTFFVHRLLGETHWRIERALLAVGAAGTVALLPVAALARDAFEWLAPNVWYTTVILIGAYASWRMIRSFVLRPGAEVGLLLISGATMLACGLHDWLVITGRLPRWDGYFIHYSALPVILVFGLVMLRRFVVALRSAESANLELEQRVAAKQRELLESHERMRGLEHQRLLADERSRIMRDMHDGVGGQMVSTLSQIEAGGATLGDVADSMRAALEDLRLMIDSLDPEIDNVPTALRLLRNRAEPRLRRAGVTLGWEVEDVEGLKLLGPEATLNLLRIVQEAFNNALRHSGADRLTLRVRQQHEPGGSRLTIEIADNGRGMPARPPEGRGVRNMHTRAAALGAQLQLTSGEHGTCIRLLLTVI